MQSRKLSVLLAATAALALATVGVAFASPARQDDSDAASALSPTNEASAYLGLVTRQLPDRLKEELGLPASFDGVIVTGVAPESPADEAGMQPRDIVFRASEIIDITEPGHLARVVAGMEPGDVLMLDYVRQGERASVDIVLGSPPDNDRPGVPGWLRKLHGLLSGLPDTVDVTINVLGEDGEGHEYVVTPGSLATVSDDVIAVNKRDGQTVRFEISDETVIVKNGERARLASLEAGTRLVVLEKDGEVAAVVAGPFKHVADALRPGRGPQVRPHMPDFVQERIQALRERHEQHRDRLEESLGQLPLSVEQARAHLEELKERYPEHVERIDKQIEQLRERFAEHQERLDAKAAAVSRRA